MLRWERDQNIAPPRLSAFSILPQCSGGSEIKTIYPREQSHRLAYHSAPVGARSKRFQSWASWRFKLTTVLRWERDQNATRAVAPQASGLPQCSGGSEIKTLDLPGWDCEQTYHSAPVGARSKHPNPTFCGFSQLTTVLRWERDQNAFSFLANGFGFLPQCSGGSEIKTGPGVRSQRESAYHSAPVGARSKLEKFNSQASKALTTVLRWERDQNGIPTRYIRDHFLPRCSGGSEIKTRFVELLPCCHAYHSAPVGARSKRGSMSMTCGASLTTVLRWERDQNWKDAAGNAE